MKKIAYFLLAAVCIIFIFGADDLYAGGGILYAKAIRAIKEKQYDFAFMEFRAVIREFPKTKYSQKAMFAVGEYFYNNSMYYDAVNTFSKYVKNYPDSDTSLFARAYLLRIMEGIERPTEEDSAAINSIRKEFFSKPVFLLFSDYKELSYRSPLNNKFKIRYYLNIIEVYRNGQIFIKIAQ